MNISGLGHLHRWGGPEKYGYWNCSYRGRMMIKGHWFCRVHGKEGHSRLAPVFSMDATHKYHWNGAMCGEASACIAYGANENILDGAAFYAVPLHDRCSACTQQFNEE